MSWTIAKISDHSRVCTASSKGTASYIIQHKLLQAMFFCKRTVQPVVTDLMGADNPLHLWTQILIKKDEAVPFDDAVHTLE